jgi:hypothetical protein
MPRRASRVHFQIFRIYEDGQQQVITPRRRRRRAIVLCALAVIAVALLWMSIGRQPATVPTARTVPTAQPHAQPAPATTVQVNGATGPICIMPTGKPKPHAVELVKVP